MSRSRLAGSVIDILSRTGAELRRGRGPWLGIWSAALLATAWILPRDRALLTAVQEGTAELAPWAGVISTLGRFENSSLALAVLLAAVAFLRRDDRWRRAAAACLLAGLLAGVTVNVFRPTLGRARPHAAVESGFYWFEMAGELHSMPSGHASTNVATAVAVLRVLPAVGVPLVGFAAAVCWSRMALNRHYPADILWGIVLGTTVGWSVGSAIAGRRRAPPSTASAPS